MEDNKVLAKWSEIKETVEALELDVAKNSRGVSAAGLRLRKGLRVLKVKTAELIKLTLEANKAKKASAQDAEVSESTKDS